MINSVIIVGRLTADPELRKTPNGTSVASFRIAHDEGRKGNNGEKQTLYINCTLFGKQTDMLARFFHKGNLIGVTGRLTQRTYMNRQNVQVTTTEILADRVDFIEGKGANDQAGNNGYQPDYPTPNEPTPQTEPASQGNNLESLDVIEDDLPF